LQLQTLTSSATVVSVRDRPPTSKPEEAVDADGAMDAQTRPQLLAKPRRRGFAQAPTAIIFCRSGNRNGKADERSPDFYASTW
jgi:hypothetical protein